MAAEGTRTFAAAEPGKTRIGWIGTGVMGRYMCEHCMDKGYTATVFNRTVSKCDPLVAKGAVLAESPRQVAENSDIVFSIVGFPSDVRQVLLAPDTGAIHGLKAGGIIVDMTTSEPSLAKEVDAACAERDATAIDAPVSGGDVGAREARLSIMVGAHAAAFEAVKPLFECMGANIRLMGPPGAGQHTKMVNQILIASSMIGAVEGLLYAHKAGLDMEAAIAAVGAGAAGSWTINNLGPRIAKRNFDPGFFVEHFVKDMSIALAESKAMGLSLPGLALVHQLYLAVQAQGHGRMGTHSLMRALETLNGLDLDKAGGAGGAGGDKK